MGKFANFKCGVRTTLFPFDSLDESEKASWNKAGLREWKGEATFTNVKNYKNAKEIVNREIEIEGLCFVGGVDVRIFGQGIPLSWDDDLLTISFMGTGALKVLDEYAVSL